MDAELDALIVERQSEAQALPGGIDRILRDYRAAKRHLELLDERAAAGGAPEPGTQDALERHLARERIRALKYDLAIAVRADRPG